MVTISLQSTVFFGGYDKERFKNSIVTVISYLSTCRGNESQKFQTIARKQQRLSDSIGELTLR